MRFSSLCPLFLLTSLAASGGCVGTTSVPVYDGPRRPASEVARIANGEDGACVELIDDRKVPGSFSVATRTATVYEVLPGPHRIAVVYQTQQGILFNAKTFRFEAEAGKTYDVVGDARTTSWSPLVRERKTQRVVAFPEK